MPGAALDGVLQRLLQRDDERGRQLERLADAVDAVVAQQASLHASVDGIKHQLEQASTRGSVLASSAGLALNARRDELVMRRRCWHCNRIVSRSCLRARGLRIDHTLHARHAAFSAFTSPLIIFLITTILTARNSLIVETSCIDQSSPSA